MDVQIFLEEARRSFVADEHQHPAKEAPMFTLGHVSFMVCNVDKLLEAGVHGPQPVEPVHEFGAGSAFQDVVGRGALVFIGQKVAPMLPDRGLSSPFGLRPAFGNGAGASIASPTSIRRVVHVRKR